MAKTKKEIEDMRQRELNLQRRELLSTIRQAIMDEEEAIEHLKDAQEKQKLIEESYQKVKALQKRLKPWAETIDLLVDTAFKHGHVFLPLRRIEKPNGKTVVVSDRPVVLKEKVLKQLFVKGVPLGNILFTDLPELRQDVEETLKRQGVTLTEESKRKLVLRRKERQEQENIRKECEKELKHIENFINEQVEKAKPEQKTELRKHLEKKYEPQKQQIKRDYGLE